MKTTWLLAALAFLALLLQAFGRDPSLFHGVGVIEIFTGGVIGLLALQMALGHPAAAGEKPILSVFIFWCAFGLLSWAIVSVAGDLPNYMPIKSGMKLKANLFDYALVYAAFFFGTRSDDDARFVFKALLGAVYFATFLHVGDSLGVIPLGLTQIFQGRVQGVIGEANQTGVFAAAFVPAFVGMALSTRGFERLFWLGGAPLMLMQLLITASRGGVVGLVFAGIVGLVVYYKFVSPTRIALFAAVGFVFLIIIFAAVGFENRSLLVSRFVGESTAHGAADFSSGRTDIWSQILNRMMGQPTSFLVGMGWDSYPTFGFKSAPHNTYLGYLFNLGLIGLGCVLFLFSRTLYLARTACNSATPAERMLLIGGSLGVVSGALSSFFVDVWIPWPYMWALLALTTRLAVNARARSRAPVPARMADRPEPGPARGTADAWGWRSRPEPHRAAETGRA